MAVPSLHVLGRHPYRPRSITLHQPVHGMHLADIRSYSTLNGESTSARNGTPAFAKVFRTTSFLTCVKTGRQDAFGFIRTDPPTTKAYFPLQKGATTRTWRGC